MAHKLDKRTILGICSGLGFIGAAAIKTYAFGWDDVPSYWIFAGVAGVSLIALFALWSRKREHRQIRDRIDRSSRIPPPRDAE